MSGDAVAIRPGLCSITLRQLSVGDVVDLCIRAGVAGVEWGADVHVPPGDADAARDTRSRCRDAGIEVVSYGSYFGMQDRDPGAARRDTALVLDTAEALGAPMVRIWTELGVEPGAPADDRARVRDRTAAFAATAATRGLVVALEFHPGCLTHTAASALALLDDIDAPNLLTHWQPDPVLAPAAAHSELRSVLPRLAHLHTFSWGPDGIDERHALADGEALWRPVLEDAAVARLPEPLRARFALCEYVRDDDPEQLVTDVATLRRWLDAPPDDDLGRTGQ
jgi:3-dehydroshikimate dehydratase